MISWRPRLENYDFVELPEADSSRAEIPPLLQRFLYSRDLIDSDKLDALLSVKPQNLTDPTKIKDMDLATNRLLLAFK